MLIHFRTVKVAEIVESGLSIWKWRRGMIGNMMKNESTNATLHLDSWAGRSKHPVTILRETPKRYKVRLEEDCLKGKKGKELYVPKYAIRRGS